MKINRKKLELAMMRACMNQVDIVKKSGVPSASISRALSGKAKPTLATIGKIAKALGVDPTEIIEETED